MDLITWANVSLGNVALAYGNVKQREQERKNLFFSKKWWFYLNLLMAKAEVWKEKEVALG